MITREQWEQLGADERWFLYDTIQQARVRSPKFAVDEVYFSDEQINAPLDTQLKVVLPARCRTMIVQSSRETHNPLAWQATIRDLVAACENNGVEFWTKFSQHRNAGRKTVYTVLQYLMAKQVLPLPMLQSFEHIIEANLT